MNTYLLTQAINVAILIAVALLLLARTRAEFNRRINEITLGLAPNQEQRKLELKARIEILQHELEELDRSTDITPPLRSTDSPAA